LRAAPNLSLTKTVSSPIELSIHGCNTKLGGVIYEHRKRISTHSGSDGFD
jgi:hypothetical protein